MNNSDFKNKDISEHTEFLGTAYDLVGLIVLLNKIKDKHGNLHIGVVEGDLDTCSLGLELQLDEENKYIEVS